LPKSFSNSQHFDFQPDIDVVFIFLLAVLNIKQVLWTSQTGLACGLNKNEVKLIALGAVVRFERFVFG